MNGISLVMATIGRVADIQRLLDSLCVQTCREFELIVVDQNPDDRLVPLMEEAKSKGLSVLHLRQEKPNLCSARNLGLAHALYEVVAFPDDDCWYERDVLEKVLKRIKGADRPGSVVIRWAEQSPKDMEVEKKLDVAKWRAFREKDASSITQFYRTAPLRKMGGFDPALGLHSWFGVGEETDLMFRFLAKGLDVVYLPDALVHHAYGLQPTLSWAAAFKRTRRRARGTGGIYAKHRLAPWVIARGLLAPMVKGLFSLHRPAQCATQLGASLGRLEGYLRWRFNRAELEAERPEIEVTAR